MAGIPGFPVLKSGKIPAPITSVLSSAIGALWGALFPGDKWGIYESGSETTMVQVDSIVEVGVNGSSEVSTYKIETGSFVSYNKVKNPTAILLQITKEGSSAVRASIVNWLETNAATPTKFDVVTPEKRYSGYTVVDYRIRRNSTSGVGMIVADMMIQEVRESAAIYSNSKISDPNNEPPTPSAMVQLGEVVEPLGDISWF